MRARNIKPGFFQNPDLAELPDEARLLFIGLWVVADRDGKFNSDSRRLRALLFPYEARRDISRSLTKLHDKGFIRLYKINGDGFGIIPHFKDHQNPHPHEAKSKIPDPECEMKCNDISCNVGLNPDSLNPDSLNQLPPIVPQKGDGRFDEFWKAYPRKVGKGAADKVWKRIKPNEHLFNQIMQALASQKNMPQWVKDGGQYIPHPATWLNQRRWEDDIQPSENGKKIGGFKSFDIPLKTGV